MTRPSLLQKHLDKTLQKYLEIPDVENININKPKEVFYEVTGGIRKKVIDENLNLTALQDLAEIIATSNGIGYNRQNSALSAKLPDGTRIEIYQTNAVLNGFSMALRKRQVNKWTLENFGFTPAQIGFLKTSISDRKTILISGGTSTGKTTILELLCRFIPTDTRLITIQDPIEIAFHQENRLDLTVTEIQPEERNLQLEYIAATAMRQNPDSVIFGEIREKTMAAAFRQLINTGHEGSMATIHANTPALAISRLVNLIHSRDGGDKDTIREELLNTIDFAIQVERTRQGQRKAYFEPFAPHNL